jgi:hypothetical protein
MRGLASSIGSVVGVALAAIAGCSGSSSGSGSGSGSSSYATLCPVFPDNSTCPSVSDASGCDLSFGTNCTASALPQGLPCAGHTQCGAVIGPVDGCGRVDAWICSCIEGHWACDDCDVGAAVCDGGSAAAYELPDGGDR